VSDSTDLAGASATLDNLHLRTKELTAGVNTFAKAMSTAFAASITGGKQFDDILKSLALRMSNMAVTSAIAPVQGLITTGLQKLVSGLTGSNANSSASNGPLSMNALGAVKPFAAGGVIGTPSYFPLMNGGVGLAGEAGPEAIMPLARGPDGRLGVSGQGGGNTINVQIATPDVDSFRRSENYLTGQIARAVARGQRSL
jgi:phage-related minor tail protein